MQPFLGSQLNAGITADSQYTVDVTSILCLMNSSRFVS